MLIGKPVIRPITKDDLPQFINLCAEHAVFEKASYSHYGKEELLAIHLFSARNAIACFVAEDENELLGYITLLKQFSTWHADFYVYMDCLYLKEKSRGMGLGRMMMETAKRYAHKAQCNLQWQTPEFNKNAIEFYKNIGAKNETKERFFWSL